MDKTKNVPESYLLTVNEYQSREIGENSDDERQFRREENRALLKKNKCIIRRFHPNDTKKTPPAAAVGSTAQLSSSVISFN